MRFTRAPHIQRESTPVTVRFSDSTGLPLIPDNDPLASSGPSKSSPSPIELYRGAHPKALAFRADTEARPVQLHPRVIFRHHGDALYE